MGLCYVTSKWADRLWDGHVKSSPIAKRIVRDGRAKQGAAYDAFAADVHARLYLDNEPHKLDGGPDWAESLHSAATDLKEWRQLKARCRHNGFSSGVATEAILDSLSAQIPESDNSDNNSDAGELPYTDQAGMPGNGDGEPTAWTDKGEGDNSELRRKLRMAIREARDRVVEAESSLDGLQESLGMRRPGTTVGEQVTYADIDKIREAHDTIRSSHNLKRIAELAGRMTRLADNSKRTKVRGAVGAVKGVELSGDIPRILPGELAGLRGGEYERLLTLAKIVNKRALSYRMEAEQSESRGPIVVAQDLSSSMRGSRDLWAKACAMAILTTATRQKRAWTFMGFTVEVVHEDHIEPSKGDVKALETAMSHAPRGGTNFYEVLSRACEIIETSDTMRRADIVLITDGEAELCPYMDNDADAAAAEQALVDRIKDLTTTQGVQLYVIGVGHDAQDIRRTALGEVATKVATILSTNLHKDTDPVVFEAVNLEG